jgi:hypothetical protein
MPAKAGIQQPLENLDSRCGPPQHDSSGGGHDRRRDATDYFSDLLKNSSAADRNFSFIVYRFAVFIRGYS